MFGRNTKILIVDDMAMFRQIVKQSLTDMGYKNYVEAVDGEAAWLLIEKAKLEKEPFALIISDWTMPKLKGIDLLKRVRSEYWGMHLPFILLTGEGEKAFIIEAIQAGVSQYIVKPFTPDQLKQKMKMAYDKAKAAIAANPGGELIIID